MAASPYLPIYTLYRGVHPESQHYGAIAVVSVESDLLAAYGDPQMAPFMRSSAKPFQALPFVEAGGMEEYGLKDDELALICASHSGTDTHEAVAATIQRKAGIKESQLLCGTHTPYHKATAERLKKNKQEPNPNRHNCSGKHSSMLALAKMQGWPTEAYIESEHHLQKAILTAIAGMCDLPEGEVKVGVDGCSAPNFAAPLLQAALGYARLMDPSGLGAERETACGRIRAAMMAHPEMVGGPDRFDTRLMEVSEGRILAKGGAEGYQGLGLPAGALGRERPAVGIAFKIADGDARGWARPAVALEVLRQLGAIKEAELAELGDFGPRRAVKNARGMDVGEAAPIFELEIS